MDALLSTFPNAVVGWMALVFGIIAVWATVGAVRATADAFRLRRRLRRRLRDVAEWTPAPPPRHP